MNIRRFTLIIFLFLAGCSPIKLGYDYADWFIFSKLDDLFDLNAEQKEFLHPAVDRLLAWHKSTELPLYASLLDQTQQNFENGLTTAELDSIYAKFEERIDSTIQQMAPDASIFLASLKTGQIERFKQNIYKQKNNPPAEIQKENQEESVSWIEDWVGELDSTQKSAISGLREAIPDLSKERGLNRNQTINEIITVIETGRNTKMIELKLIEAFTSSEQNLSSEYSREVGRQQEAIKAMILAIDKILTPAQRSHFLTKIDSLIEDIEDIHAGGSGNKFFKSLRRFVY